MRRATQRGFTLIEILVVVAIIGILAAIAVAVFGSAPKKARATEVHAVFAEIRARQLQFHNENNRFLSTGNEGAMHPGPVTNQPRPVTPLPAEWAALRIKTKTELYCSYVTVAGDANDASNIGATAAAFGFNAAPPRDWFYILAECDFDGNPGSNAQFFVHSGIDKPLELNPTH